MKPFPAPSRYYPPRQYKPDKDIGGWYVAQLHPATPSPFYILARRPAAQPPPDHPSLAKIGAGGARPRCQRGITRRHRHSRGRVIAWPFQESSSRRRRRHLATLSPAEARRCLEEEEEEVEDGGVDKGFFSIAGFCCDFFLKRFNVLLERWRSFLETRFYG